MAFTEPLEIVSTAAILRAAQYVRVSTDQQKYSIENQAAAIAAYAARRNISIVCTYSDMGRSGVRIVGRDALQQLIRDVQRTRPAKTPGRRDLPPTATQAAALDCWLAFQFQGSNSVTLLAG
jgi:hypothetical protein